LDCVQGLGMGEKRTQKRLAGNFAWLDETSG